ncbi:MAG: hypothetical protein PV340_00025 [Wolbachia sp.]|nr:hypothetical protein [Wolbachia sp.]MDD9336320.1 hypothetical protein [Wolbachia sp.]
MKVLKEVLGNIKDNEEETFELNVEGEGSGAELEGRIEIIEATEVVVKKQRKWV